MIDLCRNISEVDLRRNNNLYIQFVKFYFTNLIKIAIFPCLMYAVFIYILMLNNVNVIFEYRNISIPIFVILMLFIVASYELIFDLIKESRKRRLLVNNLDTNLTYRDTWKSNILCSDYISLFDLIVAKKYNMLADHEYNKIKKQYVQQNTNKIETSRNKLFLYDYSDKEFFNKLKQSSIDSESFILTVELKNTLEFSDDDFCILKKNFITNHVLVNEYDLESLKRLEIITEDDYYRKLYNQEKQLRLIREWKKKFFITYLIIVAIIGVVTFAVSK